MGRAILAVIVGYVAMSVVLMVTFAVLYTILGADGSFQEGTYHPTSIWIVTSIVLGFVAAVVGGLVCAGIAPRPKPLLTFIGIVLVTGVVFAVMNMRVEDPGPRTGDVGQLDAMNNAIQPVWVAFLNPFLGALGLWIGGKKARKAST